MQNVYVPIVNGLFSLLCFCTRGRQVVKNAQKTVYVNIEWRLNQIWLDHINNKAVLQAAHLRTRGQKTVKSNTLGLNVSRYGMFYREDIVFGITTWSVLSKQDPVPTFLHTYLAWTQVNTYVLQVYCKSTNLLQV